MTLNALISAPEIVIYGPLGKPKNYVETREKKILEKLSRT